MRRAKIIATWCSIILLVLALADWIYSNWNSETLILIREQHYYAVDNYKGEISLWKGKIVSSATPTEGWFHVHWEAPHATRAWQFNVINPAGSELFFAGFAITNQRRIPTRTEDLNYDDVYHVNGVVVPSWFVTLLFALLPARAAWNHLHHLLRHREGCCPQCGYDLRASKDRCPECGHAIPSLVQVGS